MLNLRRGSQSSIAPQFRDQPWKMFAGCSTVLFHFKSSNGLVKTDCLDFWEAREGRWGVKAITQSLRFRNKRVLLLVSFVSSLVSNGIICCNVSSKSSWIVKKATTTKKQKNEHEAKQQEQVQGSVLL